MYIYLSSSVFYSYSVWKLYLIVVVFIPSWLIVDFWSSIYSVHSKGYLLVIESLMPCIIFSLLNQKIYLCHACPRWVNFCDYDKLHAIFLCFHYKINDCIGKTWCKRQFVILKFWFMFQFHYKETGNIILTLQFGFCFINFSVAFKDIYFLAMYDNSFNRNNITDVAPT